MKVAWSLEESVKPSLGIQHTWVLIQALHVSLGSVTSPRGNSVVLLESKHTKNFPAVVVREI